MSTTNRKTKPFGAKFFQELRIGNVNKMKNWNWSPKSLDVINYLKSVASMPSTTGTGPNASTDERQEEM